MKLNQIIDLHQMDMRKIGSKRLTTFTLMEKIITMTKISVVDMIRKLRNDDFFRYNGSNFLVTSVIFINTKAPDKIRCFRNN